MPDPMMEARRRWNALKTLRTLRMVCAVLYAINTVAFALLGVNTGSTIWIVPAVLSAVAAALSVYLWRRTTT